MRVLKYYGLFRIKLEQGKRQLIYDCNRSEVKYSYKNKMICIKTISQERYRKAHLKYHHLEKDLYVEIESR